MPDCDHTSRNHKCGFVQFPKLPFKKAQWVAAIARADKLPTPNSKVCWCHFEDGIRGINLGKPPSIFRRDPATQSLNLFGEPKPNSRKKLLQFKVPENHSESSSSFSSGLLSASVPKPDISHQDSSTCDDDMGVSASGAKSTASLQLYSTIDDSFDHQIPVHASIPNTSNLHVSGFKRPSTLDVSTATTSAENGGPSALKQRKLSSPQPVASSSTQPSRCSTDFVRIYSIKTTAQLTAVKTQNATTQCALRSIGGKFHEYVEGSTQTRITTTTDVGTQTSVVMFDNAENFATFGDNLSAVKGLLEEIIQWRHKVSLAETKIKAHSAEVADIKKEIEASAQHIMKLNEDIKGKDEEIKKLKQAMIDYNGKHATLLRSEMELTKKLKEEQGRMLYHHISTIDARVAHFTGLPNAQMFEVLCGHFSAPLKYRFKTKVTKLSRENQLFLTLMKLRCNFNYMDLSVWFGISTTTVANIFLTFLDALHNVIFVEALKIIPSRAENRRSLPKCFKGFEECRMIIDCTEVHSANSNKSVRKIDHRGYVTLKGLVGIAPNGAVTFASSLYPESMSDNEIFENCGLLKIFEPGDLVLADKDFTIEDLLEPLGVALNVPPFLGSSRYIPDQMETTRARFNVIRAIERIKKYSILDDLPINFRETSTPIFQVCAALTNFHNPLFKDVEDLTDSGSIEFDVYEEEVLSTI